MNEFLSVRLTNLGLKVKVIKSGTVVAHLTPVNEIKERSYYIYISKEKAKELNLAL